MGSTWDPTPHKGAEWLATDGALCIVGPERGAHRLQFESKMFLAHFYSSDEHWGSGGCAGDEVQGGPVGVIFCACGGPFQGYGT